MNLSRKLNLRASVLKFYLIAAIVTLIALATRPTGDNASDSNNNWVR
jgi:hypothetical protein